jgi:hypothetical protein
MKRKEVCHMPTVYHPGQRIDHYQIIRPLGRGDASHVYLAQDWHALQEVVLKFPDDEVVGGAAIVESTWLSCW